MIENNEAKRASKVRGPITPLLVEWLLIGVATPLLFLSTASMICGMFLIITAWIVRRRAYGCWRLGTLADPALALLLLTALIGLMVSVESSVSLYRAMILLLGWVLYESTVVTVAKVDLNRQIFMIAALAALLVAGLCLTITNLTAGILLPIPGLYENLPHVMINPHFAANYQGLLNPRTIAAIAVLLWPINAFLALSKVGLPRTQRFWHALAALILIGVILFTQSPQGIVALGAAIVVFFVWHNKGEIDVPSRSKMVKVLFILTVPILIALLLLPYLPKDMLATFFSGRAGFSFVARFELWVRAWRMIETAPLTGIGLHNYSYVMDTLYPGYVLGPEAHAHQLYLQTVTDQGVLGLFGLLLLFGVSFWVTIKLIRVERDHFLKLLLVIVMATNVAWLVLGLSEVQEKAGVLVWLFLALPMGLARRRGIIGDVKKWGYFSLSVVLLTLFIFWQNGYLLYNIATITAQQALSEQALFRPHHTIALQRLAQAEKRLGPRIHIYRLRALLQVKEADDQAAAHTFRELFALESSKPLWWWAPAPVLTGELSKGEEAPGLNSIYWHWYVRYPDRVEPVALLAYTYADGMDNKPLAIRFLEDALSKGKVDQSVLKAMIAHLTDE